MKEIFLKHIQQFHIFFQKDPNIHFSWWNSITMISFPLYKRKLTCFFIFIFFNFFFILFFNFTILYWFCHISTWISHRYTRVPHPEPSSFLLPHTIPLTCFFKICSLLYFVEFVCLLWNTLPRKKIIGYFLSAVTDKK